MPAILLAGGGTGGHIFPALAVAEALRKLTHVPIVFAGAQRGWESRFVPPCGYPLELYSTLPLHGCRIEGVLRAVAVAARESVRAMFRLRSLGVRVVFSMGGYSAGPIGLAAVMMGIPLAVCEPNCVAGLTHRWLAPFVSRAYVGWETASFPFRPESIRRWGVPLRAGFVARPYAPSLDRPAHIVVLGGSQGAVALNERVPPALGLVRREGVCFQVTHQVGYGREKEVQEAYAKEGIDHVHVASFVEHMPSLLAKADIVLARAGGGVIAEVTAVGRASLLVPFPFASNDHQCKNAKALALMGAASCLSQAQADPLRIAQCLKDLLVHPEKRERMADQARALGKPSAAMDIARDLLALARICPDQGPSAC